jgi:NADH dehydrogenase
LPLKTLGDALNLRNWIIGQLEKAEVETDADRRRHLLSFVVIGGGFSGVELAGEMFDLLTASRRFYPSLRKDELSVTLIHSHDRILPELPEKLGIYARKKMEQRGIKFKLKARAHAVSEVGVRLKDGDEVRAGTVVCTIGNTTAPLIAAGGLALDHGRIVTAPDLRVPDHPNVWALGDAAAVPNAVDGQVSPTLAQFALRQAKQLARNIKRVLDGRPTVHFRYRMQGSFAAIGHHNAVGDVFGLRFSGFFAWFLWRAIYLGKMPTLARKLQIAFDWAWQLFFPRDVVMLSSRETRRIPRAHYEPGEWVYQEGDPASKFYIVEKGKASFYKRGMEAPVMTLGPGDHFGEGAIIKGQNRLFGVRAEEPLDVLTIPSGTFRDLLDHLGSMRAAMNDRVDRLDAGWRFRQEVADHQRLNTLTVKLAMTPSFQTLSPMCTLVDAIHELERTSRVPHLVLDENGRVGGICTTTDLQNALIRLKPPDTPVAAILSRQVCTLPESSTLAAAMVKFLELPYKQLVVTADDDPQRPVGLLTPFDVLRVYVQNE